ncbi:MAG: DUF2238 domain-containing protein [Rhodoferax sp.]|nr:DUF2238 domain-containing protein [Rhodoferax sp.]
MKKIDAFVLTNVFLFVLLCVFRYYARFVQYRGAAHIGEFFVYAAVIMLGIAILWFVFRHYEFNGSTLLLVQLGILMHFSGAFVMVDSHRLYDQVLFGLRYDKYVHFVNAFAATLLMSRLFEIQQIALTRSNNVFVVLVVLGLGAVIEIVEYLVVLTVPGNGVGGYDNNMQDLMANLVGASSFMLVKYLWGWRARTESTQPASLGLDTLSPVKVKRRVIDPP